MRGGRRNNNNGGNHGNGGGHSGGHQHGNNGGQRRINPRVQNFDSNGPEVRIRGNAFQIAEKYQTLARDSQSAGDRVLAESYLQHAEHYLRMINEANEEYARYNPQPQNQHQHHAPGYEPQPGTGYDSQQPQQPQQQQPSVDPSGDQPSSDGLADLDQGFLTGPRHAAPAEAQPAASGEAETTPRPRHPRRRESEAV
jgi:Domain of unknown function (DUF4167)